MFSFFKRQKVQQSGGGPEFDEAALALQNAVLAAYKVLPSVFSSVMPRLVKEKNEAHRRVVAFEGYERGQMAIALYQAATNMRMNPEIKATWYCYNARTELCRLGSQLVSADRTLTIQDFVLLVDRWQACTRNEAPATPIVKVAERMAVEYSLTPEIETALRRIKEVIVTSNPYGYLNAPERKLVSRLDCLLDPSLIGKLALPEPWQAPFSDASWETVLRHTMTATTPDMSGKWAIAARKVLDETDARKYLDQFDLATSAVAKMDTGVDAVHGDMLRGLAWLASIEGSDRAASILGRLLIACGKKIEGVGARSVKGFGGAVGALEKMGTFPALAELSKARNKVKQFGLSNSLIAVLTRAAQRQGMPIEDLEELVVPSFGLELPGVRTEVLGAVEAGLEIQGSDSAALRWSKNGKELKSVPAEVKSGHAEALKELRQILKEIESALPAQRSRIERMMLSGRTLPYLAWRERYMEHPLLADMTRRLIWRFASGDQEVLGIPLGGVPTDVEGQPISGLGDESTVRLWHPIQTGMSATEAWREFLIANEIRQPFKQAHREVYILTDAERTTRTYSNRFAAHILKQHQMAALARSRGWRYQLQGDFDNQNNPTLHLPQWDLSVEYFVVPVEDSDPSAADYDGTGIARIVSTDQVRFLQAQTPVDLSAVPPVVFSEVMRDVDLFVGVASVGNDPSWQDQGEQGPFGGYWRQVSFGDLSASAATRKAVLERLLPRLRIGKKAHIQGKFLVVQGKLRTYKIHLGSGNILMEPNDQYLCIVHGAAKASSQPNLYLPFEGDAVFSIILSKAFMLVDDENIKDPTITRQIRRK